MAYPHPVTREVDGKRLEFRLGNNELIELQGASGFADSDFEKFLSSLDDARNLKQVRLTAYHALKRQQPDLQLEDAGDIVTSLGLEEWVKVLRETLAWALPKESKVKTRQEGTPRPSVGPTPS